MGGHFREGVRSGRRSRPREGVTSKGGGHVQGREGHPILFKTTIPEVTSLSLKFRR